MCASTTACSSTTSTAVRCNVYNGSNGCPANPPLNTVRNYEAGFKIQNRYMYVDAAIYDKEFKGMLYQPIDSNHVPLASSGTYGSTARGGRIVGSVNPFAGFDLQPVRDFKIAINAEYEKAHYKGFEGCYFYQDITGATVCGSINGQQLARLPNFQIRVTPSDTQVFSWGSVTEYVTYEHVGQHYQDNTGLNPLPSYYDLAAGIVAEYGDNWEIRIDGFEPDQSDRSHRGQRPFRRKHRPERRQLRAVDPGPRRQHRAEVQVLRTARV